MLPITPEELKRWRAEVELAEAFREKEFGCYQQQTSGQAPKTSGAGLNLDLFEQGVREDANFVSAPLNLVFPIMRTILPTSFYQNPRANALPDERKDEAAEDAFYVSELVNRDIRDTDFHFKETGKLAVFDGILLGAGVVKVGYATEFGQDVLPTKQEVKLRMRDRLKQAVNKTLESVGLKTPTPEEPEPEQLLADLTIRSESAYIKYVPIFNFLIDSRARNLEEAHWVGEQFTRTVADVKRDRRYGKAKYELEPDAIEMEGIPETFIEEFQSARLYEVHYRNPDSPTGITILTFAATQSMTKPLLHEHSEYDIGGWQYQWYVPSKHGHRLWPVSAISVSRPMLERLNSSFDAMLEQLDKFVAKIIYNNRVSKDGQEALLDGTIGAAIKVDGQEDVRSAVAMISMNQLNADMVKFMEYCMDYIILIVGLTRAQLTGLTTAQTATESQIGQSGANIRRTDESNSVGDFLNSVVTTLWRVKAQFQDFTEIDLLRESAIPNPESGMMATSWYPSIDQARNDRLKSTRFKFQIEMGSIQKPNIEIVRSQLEQFARILLEPAVTNGLALDGKRISAEEFIRQYSRYFGEYGLTRLEKILVPIQDPMMRQNLMTFGQKPAQSAAANGQQQLAGSTPQMSDLISAAAGEKGQGAGTV